MEHVAGRMGCIGTYAGIWEPGEYFFSVSQYTINNCVQRVGFAPKGRPDEVHVWIKNARVQRINVKNCEDFAKKWFAWWDALNPDWRVRSGGRLKPGGTGDLVSMCVPGKNGFLNIIAVLSALRALVEADEWQATVEDVVWVIQKARVQKIQHRYVVLLLLRALMYLSLVYSLKHSRSESEPAVEVESPSKKKARTQL